MKARITFLISLLPLIPWQNTEGQILISGKISNYPEGHALFIQGVTAIGLSTTVKQVAVDSAGRFSIAYKPLKANSLLTFSGKEPIRLAIPSALNTPIEIAIDFTEPDSIQISGEQAPFVQFHLDQQAYWADIFRAMSSECPELASRDNQSAEYHRAQDAITKLRIEYLHKYFQQYNIPNQGAFIAAEANALMYSNLYYRMSGQGSDIVRRLWFYQEKGKDSEPALTYSDRVSFADASLPSIRYYRKFINSAIMDVVRFENPKGDHSSYKLYLDKGLGVINRWYREPALNKLHKTIYISSLVTTAKAFKTPVPKQEFQDAIGRLRESGANNEHLRIIEGELVNLDEILSKFAPGGAAPSFRLEDPDGKTYGLSAFQGKVVLIDVWASWSMPLGSTLACSAVQTHASQRCTLGTAN